MKSIKKILNDRIEYHNEKGERHRENGPAVIFNNGTKQWRINGKLHREDGPAVILSCGEEDWWLNGIILNKTIHEQEVIKIKMQRLLKL
jgi:hypothetical protein